MRIPLRLAGAVLAVALTLSLPAAAQAFTPLAPVDLPKLAPLAGVAGVTGSGAIGTPADGATSRGVRLVKPGEQVRLRVDRRTPVEIALVRVDNAGKPVRTVRRTRTRKGTFTATLPATRGVHYGLTVNRTAGLWLHVPPVATMTAAPTTVRAGEVVRTTIVNHGDVPLEYGAQHVIDRRTPAGWQVAPPATPTPYPSILNRVPPGGTHTSGAQVWPNLTPGRYRIARELTLGSAPAGPTFWVWAEFDVVA